MSLISQILPSAEAAGNPVKSSWGRLHKLPGGKAVFNRLVGAMAPYTGSVGAQVQEIRPGYARSELRERRAVRNHLRSIHAIALANLAEFTASLAMFYSIDDDTRFIITGISVDYVKKARGTVSAVAECEPNLVATEGKMELAVPVHVTDASGELVTRATVRALIGPKKR